MAKWFDLHSLGLYNRYLFERPYRDPPCTRALAPQRGDKSEGQYRTRQQYRLQNEKEFLYLVSQNHLKHLLQSVLSLKLQYFQPLFLNYLGHFLHKLYQ